VARCRQRQARRQGARLRGRQWPSVRQGGIRPSVAAGDAGTAAAAGLGSAWSAPRRPGLRRAAAGTRRTAGGGRHSKRSRVGGGTSGQQGGTPAGGHTPNSGARRSSADDAAKRKEEGGQGSERLATAPAAPGPSNRQDQLGERQRRAVGNAVAGRPERVPPPFHRRRRKARRAA